MSQSRSEDAWEAELFGRKSRSPEGFGLGGNCNRIAVQSASLIFIQCKWERDKGNKKLNEKSPKSHPEWSTARDVFWSPPFLGVSSRGCY